VIQYIYNQTYNVQGGIGYASAMSFIYFGVMILVLLIVAWPLARWARRAFA